jgi:hypothetical protein
MRIGWDWARRVVAVAVFWCLAGPILPARNPPAHPRPGLRRHRADGNAATPPQPVQSRQAGNPGGPQIAAQPAQALQVTCQNSLLYISAQNATLSDLFDQIQKCTGATIAAPPDLNERVAVRLGPGPPAQVIAALLAGSDFNYVIAGSAADPLVVQAVILTPRAPQPEPYVAVASSVHEDPPIESRAQNVAALTGGDEGVWDGVEVGTPTISAPAASAPASPGIPK